MYFPFLTDKQLIKILPKDYGITISLYDNPELVDLYNESGAYMFLDGECHIFASALRERFGYEIYRFGSDTHYYCIKDDGKVYVDVRGMIDDSNEFFRRFSKLKGQSSEPAVQKVKKDCRYRFAKAIIDRSPELYGDV